MMGARFARTLILTACLVLASSLAMAADAPDLTGTWQGMAALHGPKNGHRVGAKTVTYIIKDQKGHVFSGAKTYFNAIKKQEFTEPFSGTVSRDGTVYIAEHEDGASIGKLGADGSLELQYTEPGKDAKAIYVLLKKVK